MEDDRNVVSIIQSTARDNHQKCIRSFKSSSIKFVRGHHHQTLKSKKNHRINNKSRPITTIHVNIRPKINNIHPLETESTRSKKLFHSFSTILTAHHHNNSSKKISTTVNMVKSPNSITTIGSYESALPSHSSANSWDNEDLVRYLTKGREPMSTNLIHTKRNDGWPDWTSFENEHHQKKKKKKKCTRAGIILSIIGALLLVAIITTLLIIFLTKSKANTTINKSAILRWNSTGITIAGITGRKGNASNLLNFPFGLDIDYSHTLYITDTYNHRVQKYLFGTSSGITIAGQTDGSQNTTSLHLNSPCDVAVDSNGNVYIADTFNNRIQFWASGSTSGITIIGNGSSGSTSNQLNRPYGIFRDPNTGTLYIGDTNNYRVLRLAHGESSGTVVAGGNGGGVTNTKLSSSMGLYFDSVSNSIFTANAGTNGIIQWIVGASSWTLVAGNASGFPGSTPTELRFPMDVTLDPMGNVYVADTNNHRIQLFLAGQTIGETIAGIANTAGNDSNLLYQPLSITLDSQLNLYVSDAINNRIQKFLRY